MLHKIVRWLKRKEPEKTEKQLAQEHKEAMDEAIQQAARLKKVSLEKYSGWKDYCLLIQDYIDKLLQRKVITRLDTASETTKKELEFRDREISSLQWAMQIPQQFVADLEAQLKEEKEKEPED